MTIRAHGLPLRANGLDLRARGLPPRAHGLALRAHRLTLRVPNHCQPRLVALFRDNLCAMRGNPCALKDNPCALRSNPFAGPMDVELTATSLRDLIAGLAPKVQESLSILGSKV